MAAKIIDGKALAAKCKARVAQEVRGFSRRPGLAVILVGDNPASRIYVNHKKRDCAECGIYSEEYALLANASQAELLELIGALNAREDIDGILVQLPLPPRIDEKTVLDAIALQVADLVRAMNADAPCPITTLRVDGGASVSDIMMQTQADLLRLPVDRPSQVETSAFGAAALAGLAAGVWTDLDEVAGLRRSQHVFLPQRPEGDCEAQYRQWRRAVDRALRWIENDV